tara:strand:- start:105 stop:548 length:444 start_codon:yes stop_codon:yes gene_type:complete
MYKIILLLFLTFVIQSVCFSAKNNYFLMLKNNEVNVRYGPSLDSPIKFIYKKKFLPVKIIDKKENFRKIIDHKKNSGWVHHIMLKKSKSFIVLKNKILFRKPSYFSKPIAKLNIGRLLILKKCNNEWCKVETDKFTGWIDKKNLWGI